MENHLTCHYSQLIDKCFDIDDSKDNVSRIHTLQSILDTKQKMIAQLNKLLRNHIKNLAIEGGIVQSQSRMTSI